MCQKARPQLVGIVLFISAIFWLNMGIHTAARAADKFPSRPIEVIVGLAQGGGVDLIMRVIAEAAAPLLGQKVIILNKPGAAGVIGVNAVAQAKPDGYTIGGVNPGALTVSPHITNVSFTLDDFSYLSMVTTAPILFCVNADFPFKDAKAFFEHAKKNPGKFTYACDGVGGSVHFKAERIFKAMNVTLRPVPFGGAGESMKALLGKHVDIYGGSFPPALPHVKAGTIRGFFASSREDVTEIPGTLGVSALGYPESASLSWKGMIAPKGLPEDRRIILEKALQKATGTEMVRKRVREMGERIAESSGKEFEEVVRSEYKVNGVLSKAMGLGKK